MHNTSIYDTPGFLSGKIAFHFQIVDLRHFNLPIGRQVVIVTIHHSPPVFTIVIVFEQICCQPISGFHNFTSTSAVLLNKCTILLSILYPLIDGIFDGVRVIFTTPFEESSIGGVFAPSQEGANTLRIDEY